MLSSFYLLPGVVLNELLDLLLCVLSLICPVAMNGLFRYRLPQ